MALIKKHFFFTDPLYTHSAKTKIGWNWRFSLIVVVVNRLSNESLFTSRLREKTEDLQSIIDVLSNEEHAILSFFFLDVLMYTRGGL